MLPLPPSDKEKYLYTKQNKGLITLIGSLSFVLLGVGMIRFAAAQPHLLMYSGFVVITVFYLFVSYLVTFFGREFSLKKHIQILDAAGDWEPVAQTWLEWRPSVDIFLPCCGEPLAVLENTYKHVAALDYGTFKAWILDDAGLPEVEALALKYGFEYLCRPNKGEMKKSGNVRYAFARSSNDFIVILDADFAPRPDFVRETLPYFKADDKVAIVQTPQFFSIEQADSEVQKGAAYIQELFYRLIQVNRNRWKASICVGTCAVYRRDALIGLGGTYPIGHSEDVHTGFWCTKEGWRLEYVPINVSKGLCPDEAEAFFNQQYRWCTGSTTLATSKMFWKAKIPFMMRLCYLSGFMYYVATALSLFLTPLPGLYMVLFHPDKVIWVNAVFSIPSFLFGHVIMAIWSKAPVGWYSFRVRQLSYYAHFFALKDKLLKSTMAWVATGAAEARNKSRKFDACKNAILYFNTMLAFIGIAAVAYHTATFGFANFIPFLFFCLFNYWVTIPILRDQ